MKIYTQPFQKTVQEIVETPQGAFPHWVTGLDASARSMLLAQLFLESQETLLVVEPSEQQLEELMNDLCALLPEAPIQVFAAEESMALEYSRASLDNLEARIAALNALQGDEPAIVLTTSAGLRKRLTAVKKWQAAIWQLEVGAEVDFDQLDEHLSYLGYQRLSMVEAPGDYSVRGGIVDVYPLDQEHPFRLDFFDKELDSIRRFNVETQESIENVRFACLTPAKDVLLSVEELQAVLPILRRYTQETLKDCEEAEDRDALASTFKTHLSELENGDDLPHASAYLGLTNPEATSLVDYLPASGYLVIYDQNRLEQVIQHQEEEDQFWVDQEIQKGRLFPQLEIKLPALSIIQSAQQRTIHFTLMQQGFVDQRFEGLHHFAYRSMNNFFNQMSLIQAEISLWLEEGSMIQIFVEDEGRARRTRDLFEAHHLSPCVIQESAPVKGAINLVVGALGKGFELPNNHWVVLTERELFDQVRKRRPIRAAQTSNAERIKSYNELEVGDYVVHVEHGVGRYTGIETIVVSGLHRDLLAIEYQNDDRVLIPVDKVDLIQKYVSSSEGRAPKLNRLGGTEWAKTKQRVASKVEDIADELIVLYAEREQEKGYAFSSDTPAQEAFEAAFEFVETPDQLRSSEEIKMDMEKERPMDRLLVGDVGYGKTEVAMRAIFKAVQDGKQVAFLVPTTILAQQHHTTLVERFEGFGVEVGLLSRFVSAKNQQETLDRLALGDLQVVVGTHRLLSKDVEFIDLGLLIVDEEQRFGVKHKERIKQISNLVDVLTLTATPIPRTLHMSMIGIRDLSVIETPPENRFPVQTYVIEQNDKVIQSAMEREMSRGGQAFYLHNRVDTIYKRAQELEQLIPKARVAVAHGQMSEIELEMVLMDFIQGEYDLLVTTTIIETGVDIPNANTLFVEDADRMGLSTLYQLRGRVGRTHRIAYTYLMHEPAKQLTQVSEDRLQAIYEFTDLGSGFKIAMRDLSIRGAGNLLGQQQSGFIDSVGFDMYSQMLKESIDTKRGLRPERLSKFSDNLLIDVQVDAYIPDSYIKDQRQKIGIYKNIQQIDSQETYRSLQDQLIDRYGEFPDEVSDLLDIALIRHWGLLVGVEGIKQVRGKVQVTFNEATSQHLRGPRIFESLREVTLKAGVEQVKNQLVVSLNIQRLDNDQWLTALTVFLASTYKVLDKHGVFTK